MSETRSWPDAYVSRLCGFWIPRRFQEGDRIHVRALVEYLDELISRRGFVLSDGLILTKPLGIAVDREIYVPEYIEVEGIKGKMRRPISLDENFQIMVEPEDNEDPPFPGFREWGEAQRQFFGIENPYQMAEEAGSFGWSNLGGYWDILFLREGERILGALHSPKDNRHFHCDCNEAHVVYTSAARVVCMFCGATHLVLEEGLTSIDGGDSLSAGEFRSAFGEDGIFSDLDPDLPIIDFREFIDKKYIWTTEVWEAAKSEALFFLESSKEEIADYLSRTQCTPSMMVEMGWQQAVTRPSLAEQLAPDTISLDLESNAQLCLKVGLESFVRSSTDESALLDAILKVFQAIELLTKAALESRDTKALKDRPNNPTVLSRLMMKGVKLSDEAISAIERLRSLRNSIQHGEPSLNYLEGIRAVREGIVFLHQFILEEFNGWILDVCDPPICVRLLQIKELSQTADALLEERKQDLHGSIHTFNACPACSRIAIVRLAPSEGARCLVCGHIPVQADEDIDAFS
jgi:ribosomal protein S27E